MANIAKRLLDSKEKLKELTKEKLLLQGQLDGLLKKLKSEFECNTIDEAKEKLKSLKEKLSKKEKVLIDGLLKLEAEFGEM
jgi:hypothetical protein